MHKESDNSKCSTQRSDLIICFVWHYMKEKELRPLRQNCGNVSKTLEETYPLNYSTVKSFGYLCKNAVKGGCFHK